MSDTAWARIAPVHRVGSFARCETCPPERCREYLRDRTNGWINHYRRLDRHYEVTLTAHEGFLILSQIALLYDDSTAAS